MNKQQFKNLMMLYGFITLSIPLLIGIVQTVWVLHDDYISISILTLTWITAIIAIFYSVKKESQN